MVFYLNFSGNHVNISVLAKAVNTQCLKESGLWPWPLRWPLMTHLLDRIKRVRPKHQAVSETIPEMSTHACTHTQICTRTRACVHTHTHTCFPASDFLFAEQLSPNLLHPHLGPALMFLQSPHYLTNVLENKKELDKHAFKTWRASPSPCGFSNGTIDRIDWTFLSHLLSLPTLDSLARHRTIVLEIKKQDAIQILLPLEY